MIGLRILQNHELLHHLRQGWLYIFDIEKGRDNEY